jgi:hypothetical protein
LLVAENIITVGHMNSAIIELVDIVTTTCDPDRTDILRYSVIFYWFLYKKTLSACRQCLLATITFTSVAILLLHFIQH